MYHLSIAVSVFIVGFGSIAHAALVQQPDPVAVVQPTTATVSEVEEYAAQITAAYSAACSDKKQESLEALAKTAPGLRGWEYRHIQLLLSGEDSPYAKAPGKVQIGPPGFIAGLSLSPRGQRLMMGGSDGRVRIFDLETRNEVASWEVTAPAADPDDERAEWRRRARKVLFVGDGSSVLTVAAERSVTLWDIDTHVKKMSFEPECEIVTDVAVNAAGTRLLVAGRNGPINAFDIATGARTASFGTGLNFGLPLGFTPDGTRMASGGLGTVTLWDMAGNESGFAADAPPYVATFAFNRSGSLLALGTQGSVVKCVRMFDTTTKQMLWEFTGHGRGVNNVSFSPEGTRLVSSGAGVGLKIWEPHTGTLILEIPVGEAFGAATFSADGTYLAYACKSGAFCFGSLRPTAK